MAKKYFWLKLKCDFFKSKIIKKLRKIAGGDTYTIIYLKMQLLSLQNEGKIIYEGIEDSFAEELALELEEDADNVSVTLSFLEKYDLIEKVESSEFILPEAVSLIGSETSSAERVRRHREKEKLLQCNVPVTSGNENETLEIEIELDKEIEIEIDKEPPKSPKRKKRLETPTVQKHQYAEFVTMTNDEYKSLVDDERLGTHTAVNRCIEILDNYKGANGKKYKSDYRAILTWVIDRYEEERRRQKPNTENPQAEMARKAIEMLKNQQKGDGFGGA